MPAAEPSQPAPGYRADIDGLRALSVVAVILFHAEIAGFGGGYVGVDVFFVISGFLITRQLVPGMSAVAPLGLGEFYLRRARRILPALLFMLVLCSVAALLLYTPSELRYYGEALRWCAALLGNYSAWRAGDYFEPPWSYVPLRHLWSIGVEEQFYLLYPLFTLLVMRCWPKRLPAVVATMACASFALCVWASDTHPVANYFAPATRAWQLLAGASVALGTIARIRQPVLATVLAALSLAVLLAAIIGYRSGLAYPGWYALAPCLAAVFLLVTGDGAGTPVHRALAWRPLVFIGLISYSLYLWHAPVQTMLRYYFIEKPGLLATGATLLLTLLIAVASWALVERPIRRRAMLANQGKFLGVMLTVSVALMAGGHALWKSAGLPQRFQAEALRLMDESDLIFQDPARCMGLSREKTLAGQLCRYGAADGHPRPAVLWGDSHAWMLVPAFDRLARERNLELLFAGGIACRPLLGVRSVTQNAGAGGQMQRECERFNADMIQAMHQLRPSVIILAAYWNHPDPVPEPVDGTPLVPGESGLARGIEQMIRALPRDSRICVVLDVPQLPFSATHALSMAQRRGIDRGFMVVSRAAAQAQQQLASAAFQRLAARGEFSLVDPRLALCGAQLCPMLADDGAPLYWDDNHLSTRGALQVAPALVRCLDDGPP